MSGPYSTSQVASTTPTASVNVPWHTQIAHATRLLLARRLAAARLHRYRVSSDTLRGTRREKRRTWLADVLVVVGNLYLRFQGARSEVLRLRAWIAWELAVAREFGRDVQALTDRAGIECRFIPGSSLAEVQQSAVPLEQKLRATFEAAAALRQFHQARASTGEIAHWPLSHGDATVRNVIIDADTGCATWIDFDIRHDCHLPPPFRHADDLRALLWSSAAHLDPHAYSECIDTIFRGYNDAETARAVQHQTVHARCPTVFQLSQAPISAANFRSLRAAMVERLI